MSEMFMNEDALKGLDGRETVTMSKAHQQRSCVVCQQPVVHHQAESINIGGGLEVLVHRACMNGLVDAMEPKSVVIPVSQTPVKKSVRKSTVNDLPFDRERFKKNYIEEACKLLLGLVGKR
jgi:hypothetical protein